MSGEAGSAPASLRREPELAIVMPVFNEVAALPAVLADWSTVRGSDVAVGFVLVDDGSTDGSADLLRRWAAETPAVTVVTQANAGHGAACRRGYGEAIAQGARWILQVDSDGQCRAASFAELWRRRAGHDFVFGRRVGRGDGRGRAAASRLLSLFASLAAGRWIADANVPFRLIRREALVHAMGEVPRDLELYNVGLAIALRRRRSPWRGKDVAIEFPRRLAGSGSLGWSRLAGLAWRSARTWLGSR